MGRARKGRFNSMVQKDGFLTLNHQIKQIIADHLGIPISNNSKLGDSSEWTSLANVQILLSLEEAFGIFISVAEYLTLSSFSMIVAFVGSKIS